MAELRFCVGFSKACKQAREGGGLPAYEGRALRGRCLRPFLPPDLVRLIDALVRRLEHEDTLLRMNGGVLGRTLCEAAFAGGLLDVRFLLARGADLEATTVFVNRVGAESRWTALTWAANAGHLAVCLSLLDAGTRELDKALYGASFNGHTPVVALLLDRGADINFDDGGALVGAALQGCLATVTLLLDRGADVHVQEDRALVLAASYGYLEVARLLLDRGANVHADDDFALIMASQNGRAEAVRLLLDRGADVHAQREMPLQMAVFGGHLETVRLLLDNGGDVLDRALLVARQRGHAAVEALLLERAAVEIEPEG
jgi:ankyrin repeat protein